MSLAMLCQAASAQNVITTAAGNGNPDNKGADIALPGPSAELRVPAGLAMDDEGNLYVADGLNAIVRVLDTNGNMRTIAGDSSPSFDPPLFGSCSPASGLAADAIFAYVESVEINPVDGRLYLADDQSDMICAINLADGTIERVAGTPGAPGFAGDGSLAVDARLDRPSDIAFDSAGNMYIADFLNHVIRRVDAVTGVITTFAGTPEVAGYNGDGGDALAALLQRPVGVAVDSNDNVYIADGSNNAIRRVDAVSNVITTYAGNILGPRGLQFDDSDNLYFGENRRHQVQMIDAATGIISKVAGTTSGFGGDYDNPLTAQLNEPWDVALAPDGTIFISDLRNHRVRKIAPPTDNARPDNIELEDPTITPDPTDTNQEFANPFRVFDADGNDAHYVTLLQSDVNGDGVIDYDTPPPEGDGLFTIFTNAKKLRLREPANTNAGVYTVRIQADDYEGGVFVEDLSVTVNDGEGPVITLLGDNPQILLVGTDYTELGAEASDEQDGDLSADIVIDASAVDTSTVGDYEVTYNVVDSLGNPAEEVTRAVRVSQDAVPPVITIAGTNPLTIDEGDTYNDAGATATDDVDGDLTSEIVTTGSVNTAVPGNYTITYSVTDAAGNAASASRSVTVREVVVTPPPVQPPPAQPSSGGGGSVDFLALLMLGWLLLGRRRIAR